MPSPIRPATVLRRALAWAADLLYPPSCVGCRVEGAFLCPTCAATLPRLAGPGCPHCGQPGPSASCGVCRQAPLRVDGILAPFLMDGLARELVHRLKYRDQRALAPMMGELMAACARERRSVAQVVVPVPLHPSRERTRGYNQAALLAHEVARALALPCLPHALRRVRATSPQVAADRQARQRNVAGAFLPRAPLQGLWVLLVDDVCTTGATLEACAQALRAAGAARVTGLVLARTP